MPDRISQGSAAIRAGCVGIANDDFSTDLSSNFKLKEVTGYSIWHLLDSQWPVTSFSPPCTCSLFSAVKIVVPYQLKLVLV